MGVTREKPRKGRRRKGRGYYETEEAVPSVGENG